MVAPALIPNRTIFNKRGRRGLANLHVSETLEDVRDHLRKMANAQQAVDHDRSFSQLMLTFEDDHVRARVINNPDESWIVSKTAFGQMDANLLPRSGGNFLMALSALDHAASHRAATANWAMFAAESEDIRTFRTVRTRMPDGSVERLLRAQVSTSYAAYSNLEFVQDLLDNTDVGNLRMLDWRIDDDAMRFRVGAPDGEVEVNTPFPMFKFWNSETGKGSTRIDGGLFRASCLNGMGSWDKSQTWKKSHRGNPERIRQGVASAMTEISMGLNGTQEAYQRACDVFIDDAFAFVDQMLDKSGATKEAIESIKTRGMTDPTSSDADSLAGVVDGITLIAQDDHRDLFESDLMEQIAADVMRRGLAQSKRDRILVRV